ncbi:MAG: hypothetical protein GC181_07205 [Bacteroidetes bacterium]|nr:hypothetical protein [Bacteroidota bacterium]
MTRFLIIFIVSIALISCVKLNRVRVSPESIIHDTSVFSPETGWFALADSHSIGRYSRIGKQIFCGEIGCKDYPVINVDVESFEVWPGTNYARDKKRVYYPETFICRCGDQCGTCYNSDPEIKGADPVSFKCVAADSAVDKNSYYLGNKKFPRNN